MLFQLMVLRIGGAVLIVFTLASWFNYADASRLLRR
jgi:hypothetical protein